MSIPTDLDRRFREAAARSGMLDAGYDLVDTPLGRAARRRDRSRAAADLVRSRSEEPSWSGSRAAAGRRVLRSPATVDGVAARARRVLRGAPPRVRPRRRSARGDAVHASGCCTSSRAMPFGETATYAGLAERAGNPKAARAVGMT